MSARVSVQRCAWTVVYTPRPPRAQVAGGAPPRAPSRLAECREWIASARDVPSPSAAVPRARARVGY